VCAAAKLAIAATSLLWKLCTELRSRQGSPGPAARAALMRGAAAKRHPMQQTPPIHCHQIPKLFADGGQLKQRCLSQPAKAQKRIGSATSRPPAAAGQDRDRRAGGGAGRRPTAELPRRQFCCDAAKRARREAAPRAPPHLKPRPAALATPLPCARVSRGTPSGWPRPVRARRFIRCGCRACGGACRKPGAVAAAMPQPPVCHDGHRVRGGTPEITPAGRPRTAERPPVRATQLPCKARSAAIMV